MAQDRLLELLEARPRLDAEGLDQLGARRAVDVERLDLPAGAVERDHQQLAQALAQRVLGGQLAQLGNDRGVAAERELRLEPASTRGQPQLLEPRDRPLGERLVREVGQRGAAPERRAPRAALRGGARVARLHRAAASAVSASKRCRSSAPDRRG